MGKKILIVLLLWVGTILQMVSGTSWGPAVAFFVGIGAAIHTVDLIQLLGYSSEQRKPALEKLQTDPQEQMGLFVGLFVIFLAVLAMVTDS